jgi:2,4-dienoyl-CoA reductase-like NADH-dependent reductase (Old Yellow Enzyme family)/thioredoxin reductase
MTRKLYRRSAVSKQFKRLYSPIQIGGMEVGNRIALAPMANYMSDERGSMTQPQIDLMEARAKGGAGLLIMGSIYVQHPHARFGVGQLGLYEDSLIPGYERLVEAVKAHGVKLAAQIHHAGRQTTRAAIEGRQPVAPSPIARGGKYSDRPRELSVAEIREVIRAYAQTARRCIKAGFDAIEIHSAHGYLPCEFMSPFSNKRSDEYGGDLNGRMRFTLELLEEVKGAVGADIPVWCRIIGSELVEGGLTIDDMTIIAKMLADAGSAAISVSRGIAPYYWTVANYYADPGYSVPYAAAIKAAVDVPVMVAGRINEPQHAEEILRNGDADIIGLGRALIADPEWPNKAASGRAGEIRPCINCNKGCHDPTKKIRHTICLVNAEAGREREFQMMPVEKAKQVMVIGGGPSGLEAARVAAMRGHSVTVYEKSERLGGRWYLGCQVPQKEHFYQMIEHFRDEAVRHGARIEMGRTITAADVGKQNPDAVIVAVGARPIIPPIPGADQDFVVTSDDVLAGRVEVGERVVIVGGGSCGAETADFLAVRGKKPIVVEMLDTLCPDMLPDAKYFLLERLEKAGVAMLSSTKVETIKDHQVVISRQEPGQDLQWTASLDDVDTVVLAVGARPNRDLVEQLEALEINVYAVGDCVEPGFAIDAIYQGAKAGREV